LDKEQVPTIPLQQSKYTVELVWSNNTIVLHPKGKHTHTLIWMHGIGDSGKDYKGMFMDDSLVNLPDGCKVILPTAKKRK
jgi:predicted esterase